MTTINLSSDSKNSGTTVWMDIPDENSQVPSTDGSIFVKASRLSLNSVNKVKYSLFINIDHLFLIMLQVKNNAEPKSLKNVIPQNKLINADHGVSPDLIESSGRNF